MCMWVFVGIFEGINQAQSEKINHSVFSRGGLIIHVEKYVGVLKREKNGDFLTSTSVCFLTQPLNPKLLGKKLVEINAIWGTRQDNL